MATSEANSPVRINIGHGLFTTVDPSDYELASQYKWYPTSGVKDNTTYANTRSDGKTIRLHRLLLGFPKQHIDHIDGNGLNNCRSNLRLCDHSQNQANSKPRTGCTSKYKGVTRKGDRWVSKIRTTRGRGQSHLGTFKSEKKAAHAYNVAAHIVYGEFARLNDVPPQELPERVIGRLKRISARCVRTMDSGQDGGTEALC